MTEKRVIVYGLRLAGSEDIRYIGQTTQSLAKRLDSHIHVPKIARLRACYKWISAARERGDEIEAVVLCDGGIWNQTEQEMIALYRSRWAELLNHTDGGGGVLGRRHTPETRMRMSERRMGIVFSESHRANLLAAQRSRSHAMSTESVAKLRASMKGKIPANLAALHIARRGRPVSQETRDKISATLKRKNK